MKKQLIETAVKAREKAYAPYSHYKVGAALLAKSGKIYTGCNVENASFTPTNCAERTAFFKAISEGDSEFEMIAIVAGKDGEELSKNCTPCGVWRYWLLCRPIFNRACIRYCNKMRTCFEARRRLRAFTGQCGFKMRTSYNDNISGYILFTS